MDELRVILLLLGAAILGAVYFFSRPSKPRQARDRDGRPAAPTAEPGADPEDDEEEAAPWRDPDPPRETLSRELKRLGDLISKEKRPGAHDDTAPEPARRTGASKSERRASDPESPTGNEPSRTDGKKAESSADSDRIIVLYVKARGDERIGGRKLVAAAEMAGLEYGDMDIYHRLDEAGHRETMFSMANMVAPGTLGQAQSPDFSTPGVALFMRLPGPVAALDGWDAMHATARRIAEILDAELLDESHSSLNRQRVQQIREEMREFDRLQTIRLPRG